MAHDFIIPVMGRSVAYDRGSGYFSILTLASLADGIVPFIKNNGRIRLITSVNLSQEDIKVIRSGLDIQQGAVLERLNQELMASIDEPFMTEKLDVITNMIAANRLTIKIAYMPTGGIYHEKIGFFKDSDGNIVYFTGSSNETYGGYKSNWESDFVISSWSVGAELIKTECNYFDNLWNDKIAHIKVLSFPEALKRKLFDIYKKSPDLDTAVDRFEEALIQTNGNIGPKKLHPYQQEAIRQFVANNYHHFFEMATGTGKTFTAVKAVEELHRHQQKLAVIVLVPQIDLQNQWLKAFKEVGLATYLFGGLAGTSTEDNFFNFTIDCFNKELTIGISTYDTFFSKLIQQIKNLPQHLMVIIDEAHNLSPNQINNLPERFQYRLGLSATPERYDVEQTDKIINYFTLGKVETYKYTIENAIESGFLSHYKYTPIFTFLDEEDFEQYQKFTKYIVFLQSQDPKDYNKIVDTMTQRSLIIKKANTKLNMLEHLVGDQNYNFQNSVVYCGQGKDDVTDKSIIDSVTQILAYKGKYKVSQFTSKTEDRTRVLTEFENGYFDVLVAIKCFDEGVDVPKLDKIYIMASDALNRQTIQRRGRVLRKCKETGKTIANIYDFVVLPPNDKKNTFGVRSLLRNELRRVTEYARLADNCENVTSQVDSILEKYHLDKESLDDESEG